MHQYGHHCLAHLGGIDIAVLDATQQRALEHEYLREHVRKFHQHFLLVLDRFLEALHGLSGSEDGDGLRTLEEGQLQAEGLAIVRSGVQLARLKVLESLHGGGHQGHLAFHRLAQKRGGHQQAVDLVGAFVDAVATDVSVQRADLALGAVAHATVYLQCFVHHQLLHLRAVHLGHGTLQCELGHAALLGFQLGHATSDHAFQHLIHLMRDAVPRTVVGIDAGGHGGDLPLDGTERSDRLTELHPLVGVAHTQPESALGDGAVRHRDLDPTGVQRVHGDLEALVAFA